MKVITRQPPPFAGSGPVGMPSTGGSPAKGVGGRAGSRVSAAAGWATAGADLILAGGGGRGNQPFDGPGGADHAFSRYLLWAEPV